MQRKEKGWQPVFPKTNDSHLPVEEIYDHLWTGARTFIEDFGEQQPQLSDETGHDYLEAVLERLLHHPTREEAQMLVNSTTAKVSVTSSPRRLFPDRLQVCALQNR